MVTEITLSIMYTMRHLECKQCMQTALTLGHECLEDSYDTGKLLVIEGELPASRVLW